MFIRINKSLFPYPKIKKKSLRRNIGRGGILSSTAATAAAWRVAFGYGGRTDRVAEI